MKTIPLAKAKARRPAGATGALASVAPPPEDLDSEIDAMVREIYEARAKSARSMARAFRALTS
jgi:hypothetical protein